MKKGLLIGLVVVLLSMVQSPTRGQDLTLTDLYKVLRDRGARWQAGETSMNKLAPEERKARLGLMPMDRALLESKTIPLTSASSASPVAITPTLDWRNNGGNYVTSVKNQGSCGSCWAFSSTAALESATLRYKQTPNVDLDLSEQVLLSCGGAGSCGGGYPDRAADFIKASGLPPESCYPYTGANGSCSMACSGWQNSADKIFDWLYFGSPSVDTLKNALNTYGPLVTTMAVYYDFFSYQSGVYHCVSGDLAGYHAILLVGYDDVNQCFIVKNSWGTGWGEQGFFRIAYTELNSATRFAYETIAYEMASICMYTLSSTSQSVSAAGVTSTVGVNAGSGCAWTAVSNATSWLSITAGSSGSGSGTVRYFVAANTTTSTRTGTLTVGGQTFTVTQAAGACASSITPTTQTLTASAGASTVSVTSPSGCAWTATSNASPWLTVTSGASGSGNGTIGYSVTANTSNTSRSGTITVAGQTFTVTQAGGTCTSSISPTTQTFTASAGAGTVNVTSASGCAWTAVSNATSWLTVTSGANGSGNGTVGYSVAANTTTSARSGTLTVAGQTFTVSQATASCTYSISPAGNSLSSAAGAGSVSVTSPTGCAWTASTASLWITITSGSSGSGNGKVTYAVAANPYAYSRSDVVSIAGQTHTVTQAASTCTYDISPTTQSFTTAANAGSVAITPSNRNCAWTASSNAPWITITSVIFLDT